MAEENFYLDLYNEEIESKIKGAVVYNDYQELSAMEKAQARRNIGAGTVDSGLIIKGYYATYEELTAAQPNPQISDAYGVGTEPPYNIFVWDNVNKMWVNNGTITKGDKGDPGKDGEAPTAENIAAALGYTPAANDLSNVANGAVTNGKIANGAVTRAKLANDALYSPHYTVNTASYTISVADLGKSLYANSSGTNIVITLPLSVSQNLPDGAEIAIFHIAGASVKIVFDSAIKSATIGDAYYTAGRTYSIPERFGICALKKIGEDNTKTNFWVVTGNVEVVS